MNSEEKSQIVDMRVAEQLMRHKRNGLSAFERLLPIFREETSMLIAQIRCAVNASDSEGLQLTAHKLKGSASVLGALEVRQFSIQIMDNASEGVYPNAEALQLLEQSVEQFYSAALALLGRD